MGPLGPPARGADDAVMIARRAPPVELPPDLTARARSLPADTLLRRLRMIAAVAQCWQGVAQGSKKYSQLEEGRSKLPLSKVHPGLGAAAEVAKRVTLCEVRLFEDLLRRVEEHLLLSRMPGKTTQRGNLASEGAHRKATTGLVSSML